jgi:SAM-dependent methyltransferase
MLPDWALSRLACPRDSQPLQHRANSFTCPSGHVYPVHNGIPVLLRDDVEHTHEAALYALRGEEHERPTAAAGEIDPFVQEAIGATGGYLYEDLIGRLTEYPIPELRMRPGAGAVLVDLGCSWGRWSIAASRLGYRAIGIDPSLEGVRAAYRVARQLGVKDACFVVADARYPPLADASVDAVFSYSVLQHFSKENVRTTLEQVRRILAPGGRSLIQLPNAFGLRSLYHQLKRGLREPRLFEVRYWTVGELRRTFGDRIGPTEIFVDGFFSLNPQSADLPLLSPRARVIVRTSEMLRRLSNGFPPLKYAADSLYVSSLKRS